MRGVLALLAFLAVTPATAAPLVMSEDQPLRFDNVPGTQSHLRRQAIHYNEEAAPFAQPILTHLRGLIHAAVPGLDETVKWGMPHFTLGGRNFAGISNLRYLYGYGRAAGPPRVP